MAGVHSTVWILAVSAAVISRARSNSSWSDQDGCSTRSALAIALCSSVNSVCIRSRPSHQLPLTPVTGTPVSGSSGSSRSVSTLSRPPTPARTVSCVAWSLP